MLEKLTVFLCGLYIVGIYSVIYWLSKDTAKFKVDVGVCILGRSVAPALYTSTKGLVLLQRSSYFLCIHFLTFQKCSTTLQSVGPESVLWQDGWLDLDAIWRNEWDWSRDGCIRWGPCAPRARSSFEGFSHPLVSMSDFLTEMYLTSAWKVYSISVRRYIIGIDGPFTFYRYSQVWDGNWLGSREICKNVTVILCKVHALLHAAVRWHHGDDSIVAGCAPFQHGLGYFG